MTTNLTDAYGAWATMPPESRYWTVADLDAAARSERDRSYTTSLCRIGELRVEAHRADLRVVGNGSTATLGHAPTAQLAQAVGAPVGYLRTLAPTLAAQNLNYGLSRLNGERRALYLLRDNAQELTYSVRSIDGADYARIHNADLTSRLVRLVENGWRVPPARPSNGNDPRARQATEADVLSRTGHPNMGIKIGDMISPAGLYLDADSNMFAFLVNEDRIIADGSPDGLARGFFLKNTEVCGVSSWSLTTFLYRYVCGNHIVWEAKDVYKTSFRHVGRVADRIGFALKATVSRLDVPASVDEARIKAAQSYVIGASKDAVLDRLFGLKIATRDVLGRGFDAADQNHLTDGSPASAWGMAQGLTRISQGEAFATDRAMLDRAAGKVLELSS